MTGFKRYALGMVMVVILLGFVILNDAPAPSADDVEFPTGNPPAQPTQASNRITQTSKFTPAFVDESVLTEPVTPAATPFDSRAFEGYCGDRTCDATEDCSSCRTDCGCSVGAYCALSGRCMQTQACGDGRCTPYEESTDSCCSDCGCASGTCKPDSQTCEMPQTLTASQTEALVRQYVNSTGFNLTDYRAVDTYASNAAVKMVLMDCPTAQDTLCTRIVIFALNGSVLSEWDST